MIFPKTLLFLVIILMYCAFQCIVCTRPPVPLSNPPTTKKATDLLIKKGIQKKRYTDGQTYYTYIPKTIAEKPHLGTEILAVIHGYQGQANGLKGQKITLKNMKRFIPYAEKHNTILIAPHFSEKIFDSDYQRFNLDATRSDIRLINLIQLMKNTFPNLKEKKLKLFGFSGGGQFVHRFCAFHPKRIHKAVTSGSGWYMWPDHNVDYPVGLKLEKFPMIKPINLELFIQCHLLVLIGEKDTQQGSFRIDYKDINLNDMQGYDRISRARHWVAAIKKYARSKGLTSNISLKTIPKTEHRTTKDLMDAAFDFLAKTKTLH